MNYPKVIIQGHVFDYKDKAPFVRSGKSVLGAMEYDPENSLVKCHECGEGFTFISAKHLQRLHGLESDQYKARHGLNLRTGLCTPAFSAMRSCQYSPTPEQTAVLVNAGREYKRLHGNNTSNRKKPQAERANAIGRCQVQTLFRLQVLAAELKRTPTSLEMQAAKLDQPLLIRQFGGAARAMELAGLTRRPGGRPISHEGHKLPAGFPTLEQLVETRMPWAKEYFRLNEMDALSRRAAPAR